MNESTAAILKRLGAVNKLTPEDIPDLQRAELKVLRLMADGKKHTATEIIAASGVRSGLRRMRTLRTDFCIREERSSGSREWIYWIQPKPVQPELTEQPVISA